jgi:hypothetical protein
MKKKFTNLFCSCSLLLGLITGLCSKAQTQPALADTTSKNTFKPTGKLWGHVFGDAYYKAHSDSLGRGGSNQYTGVPKGRSAFQIRRVYLGYDYDITKEFSVELLLAAEENTANYTNPAAVTSSAGDQLADGKLSFYLKFINLRWKNIFNGTDLVVGQMATPASSLLINKIWNYRPIERTVASIRRTQAYDLGVALQGTFDPATKNYGYNIMIGNGTGARPENDAFKWFYADVYAKFMDQKLIFDLYGDYEGFGNSTQNSTLIVPNQSRSMVKGFVAYSVPKITVGIEAFENVIKGGALTTTMDAAKIQKYVDVNSLAISMYVRGPIVKDKLGFFARYDNYNPNNNYNTSLTYTSPLVLQYDSNIKEQFITTGLDFTPNKNIHFMPNIWYNKYTAQQNTGIFTAGAARSDYDLVCRLTAFFSFGK